MLFFLIMGIPVFVTGGKLNLFACCVRHEHDASHGDDGGTTVCGRACLFDFPLISLVSLNSYCTKQETWRLQPARTCDLNLQRDPNNLEINLPCVSEKFAVF